eukprot:jgi/Mesen1/7049/ME000369S06369
MFFFVGAAAAVASYALPKILGKDKKNVKRVHDEQEKPTTAADVGDIGLLHDGSTKTFRDEYKERIELSGQGDEKLVADEQESDLNTSNLVKESVEEAKADEVKDTSIEGRPHAVLSVAADDDWRQRASVQSENLNSSNCDEATAYVHLPQKKSDVPLGDAEHPNNQHARAKSKKHGGGSDVSGKVPSRASSIDSRKSVGSERSQAFSRAPSVKKILKDEELDTLSRAPSVRVTLADEESNTSFEQAGAMLMPYGTQKVDPDGKPRSLRNERVLRHKRVEPRRTASEEVDAEALDGREGDRRVPSDRLSARQKVPKHVTDPLQGYHEASTRQEESADNRLETEHQLAMQLEEVTKEKARLSLVATELAAREAEIARERLSQEKVKKEVERERAALTRAEEVAKEKARLSLAELAGKEDEIARTREALEKVKEDMEKERALHESQKEIACAKDLQVASELQSRVEELERKSREIALREEELRARDDAQLAALDMEENDFFDEASFKSWVNARCGVGGNSVYWYSSGEVYSYPEGKLLVRVEGFDSSRGMASGPSSVVQLSKKLYIFRDKDTNALLTEFNGQAVKPIMRPLEHTTYTLEGSQMTTRVIVNTGEGTQILGGNLMSVRHMQNTTRMVYSCPVFVDIQSPAGGFEAYENHDYFVDKAEGGESAHCSTVRVGCLPPFAEKTVMHLVGWRLDSFDLLPPSIQDYVAAQGSSWQEAPHMEDCSIDGV